MPSKWKSHGNETSRVMIISPKCRCCCLFSFILWRSIITPYAGARSVVRGSDIRILLIDVLFPGALNQLFRTCDVSLMNDTSKYLSSCSCYVLILSGQFASLKFASFVGFAISVDNTVDNRIILSPAG